MSRSSSPSEGEPFGFLVARGPVADATSASSWLRVLLDAEATLAHAQAAVGDIPAEAAAAIADACRIEHFDVAAIFDEAVLGGNPVIPLVTRLRDLVGDNVVEFVHRGATSQDIMDAATLAIVQGSAEIVGGQLLRITATVRDLQSRYGSEPMIARALGQHALPTTFATVTARWIDGLGEAAAALQAAPLAIGLGGPTGDGTSYGAHHIEIVERFAEQLGLRWHQPARHAQRTATAGIAGAWGLVASAVAKVALDIVLLAQSDVGELSERAEGAGVSSSMDHKRNPIAAICARAAAMQAPGLVATLLHAAGSHELERAAGSWHAEWPALNELLRSTGSAVDWLHASVQRLHVDDGRMAQNLAASVEAAR